VGFSIGSVKVDVRKAERPFDLISFSDFDSVKGLIRNRSMIDHYRGIEIDRHPSTAGEVRPMNPAIIALFISLDDLLNECSLNKKQKFIIERIMDGYTEQDVAEVFDQDVSSIMKTVNRVCKRVVEINNRNWKHEFIYTDKLRVPFKYKKCIACKDRKPLMIDFFYIDVLNKDGYKNKCRSCMSR
jgi:hypothetical protein